ncbi:hypothetical protein [Litorisediminicola beolgyonensis]|uniref:Holin-X, holin superfamily III n=1 Tax=Litorisediminicola beolgyonensis TaxID=1173614 RepID=A0ABW3ZE21_9RHOB
MGFFPYLEFAARRKARAAAFSIVGLVFLLTGIAFLGSALFMILSAWKGALFAAQVLGGLFFGLGLICFAISRMVGRLPPRPVPATTSEAMALPVAHIIEGLIVGFTAGRRTRAPRKTGDQHAD